MLTPTSSLNREMNMKQQEKRVSPSLLIDKLKSESTENEFSCPICLFFVSSPLMCSNCETIFCQDCLYANVDADEKITAKCVKCQEIFVSATINKPLLSVLYESYIYCPFLCNSEIQYKDLQSHLTGCIFKLIQCGGCQGSFTCRDFNFHISICPDIEIQCPIKCGAKVKRCLLNDHNSHCDKVKIECSHCGIEIIRSEYYEHIVGDFYNKIIEDCCNKNKNMLRIEHSQVNLDMVKINYTVEKLVDLNILSRKKKKYLNSRTCDNTVNILNEKDEKPTKFDKVEIKNVYPNVISLDEDLKFHKAIDLNYLLNLNKFEITNENYHEIIKFKPGFSKKYFSTEIELHKPIDINYILKLNKFETTFETYYQITKSKHSFSKRSLSTERDFEITIDKNMEYYIKKISELNRMENSNNFDFKSSKKHIELNISNIIDINFIIPKKNTYNFILQNQSNFNLSKNRNEYKNMILEHICEFNILNVKVENAHTMLKLENLEINKKELVKWENTSTMTGHTHHVYCMIQMNWSLDDTTIVTGSADHTIKLWNASEGVSVRTITGHTNTIFCVEQIKWSLDETTLVSGGADYVIKFWNALDGSNIKNLTGHTNTIYCLHHMKWSKDENTLISGSADKNIKIWNILDGTNIESLHGHEGCTYRIIQMDWTRDESTLLSCSADFLIKVWDVLERKEKKTLKGHTNKVYCMSQIKSNDDRIVSGGIDKKIFIWNVFEGTCIKILSGHNHCIYSLSPIKWTLGDYYIISGCFDKTIKLWNVADGQEKEILSMTGHSQFIHSVVHLKWKRDQITVVSGSSDNSIKLWKIYDIK